MHNLYISMHIHVSRCTLHKSHGNVEYVVCELRKEQSSIAPFVGKGREKSVKDCLMQLLTFERTWRTKKTSHFRHDLLGLGWDVQLGLGGSGLVVSRTWF